MMSDSSPEVLDVADWLQKLGLGQYQRAFRQNEINCDVLPSLTADDLKELGVALVGHRRRLLDAAAALRAGSSPQPPSPTEDGMGADRSAPSAAEAERRQLTVLFCDLVGSTELSQLLDPEELRDVLRGYQRVCADAVARFGGHLAKYLGDGIMAYFGYPTAYGDDARRAALAGLAVVDEISRLKACSSQISLHVRMGIETGLVVVGEMGSGETREALAVVGETPNVAARLQALAAPDTVVIGAATHHLAGRFLVCEPLGPQILKGIAERVAVYRVLRGVEETDLGEGTGPLVGRQHELALMVERWRQAVAGSGSLVLLSGEAGIGKSRLLRALKEAIASASDGVEVLRCGALCQNSAFHPMIERLERQLELCAEAPVSAKLERLHAALAERGLDQEEAEPLIAALLSLPLERPQPGRSPDELRKKLMTALLGWVVGPAARRPAVLVVEDLHWADASTIVLLGLLVEQLPTQPILAVFTFRPEFIPPWPPRSHIAGIALTRLDGAEVAAIAERVSGGKRFPETVLQQIREKTDGVPLFVEELTRMVLEMGMLKEHDDRYELAGSLPAFAIPSTLRDSLTARLDRLSGARHVAQLAAALGREFSFELLQAVSGHDPAVLESELTTLTGAEIIYQRGLPPQAIYSFKHALTQDAAYDTLLKSTRQQVHARIAATYETRFATVAESRPELVAHHLTEAGDNERAAGYWQSAGELALRRSATGDAVTHFTTALRIVEGLADASEHALRELEIRLRLGTALVMRGNAGDPEVGANYVRSCELGRVLGDSAQLLEALWGSWFVEIHVGRAERACALADELVALAERLRDEDLMLEAYHSRWANSLQSGEVANSLSDMERGIALYVQERHHAHAYRYVGHDPGVCARGQSAIALWFAGLPDQAARRIGEATALAQQLAHPATLAYAAWWSAVVQCLLGNAEGCRAAAETTVRVSQQQDFPMQLSLGRFLVGWSRLQAGEVAQGLQMMEEAFAVVRQLRRDHFREFILSLLAGARLRRDALQEGLAAVRDGREIIRTGEFRLFEAELYRVEGECLIALDGARAAEAEVSFQRAIETANRQGALSLELRAATNLAHLWGDLGKRLEARELLAPIYARFTEGFDTSDLKNAKTLLATLQ
jgi:class 3 adenylate cyclase/predicted ATPase